jgi:hypothetical protein
LEDNRLAQISLIVSGNSVIYFRSYRKLFDLISTIGGFFNSINYASYLILYLYSQNTILFHSISSIISEQEIYDSLENSILENNEKKKIFKPELIKINPKPNSNSIRRLGLDNEIRDFGDERQNNSNLMEDNRGEVIRRERQFNRPPAVDNSRTHLPINDNSNINQELQNRNNIDVSNNSRQ